MFICLGAGGPDQYPHHNPRFDIDERCMKQAVEYFAGFALAYLNG